MSNEKQFEWNDKNVSEILEQMYSDIRNEKLLTVIVPGYIQQFKASHIDVKEKERDWEILTMKWCSKENGEIR